MAMPTAIRKRVPRRERPLRLFFVVMGDEGLVKTSFRIGEKDFSIEKVLLGEILAALFARPCRRLIGERFATTARPGIAFLGQLGVQLVRHAQGYPTTLEKANAKHNFYKAICSLVGEAVAFSVA